MQGKITVDALELHYVNCICDKELS